jgi:L-arabinokinase
LPHQISGKDFLDTYGASIDLVTSIQENTRYDIATCTSHPIHENERVHQFKELITSINQIENSARTKVLEEIGELMYQSHESYSRCGLGSERTDEIVRLSKQYPEIYGAKITGGGSGGTVCLLAFGEVGRRSISKIREQISGKYHSSLKIFN